MYKADEPGLGLHVNRQWFFVASAIELDDALHWPWASVKAGILCAGQQPCLPTCMHVWVYTYSAPTQLSVQSYLLPGVGSRG